MSGKKMKPTVERDGFARRLVAIQSQARKELAGRVYSTQEIVHLVKKAAAEDN